MSIEKLTVESPNGRLEVVCSVAKSELCGAILCLHGGPGGDLSGNTSIFDDLAKKASSEGFAVIQFSFSGSGESGGSPHDISIKNQLVDYHHMVQYAKTRFEGPLHVAGESAGCTVASQSWNSEVESYLMLWPAFDLSDSDLSEYLDDEHHSSAKETGYVEDGSLIMPFDLIDELRTINFEKAYNLPQNVDFFIAHGQKDFEVPYSQSLRAATNVTGRFQFFGHPDADHGFKSPDHRSDLLVQIDAWLKILKHRR